MQQRLLENLGKHVAQDRNVAFLWQSVATGALLINPPASFPQDYQTNSSRGPALSIFL